MGGSLAKPILGYLPDRIVARVQPSLGDACDGALLLARGSARSDLTADADMPHHSDPEE